MVSLALCKAAIMEYWQTGNTELLQEVDCQIAMESEEAAEQSAAPDAATACSACELPQ